MKYDHGTLDLFFIWPACRWILLNGTVLIFSIAPSSHLSVEWALISVGKNEG